MAAHTEVQVVVQRASLDEKRILANLLQLHSHDMSEFNGEEVGEDGLFWYEDFDSFWTLPEYHPFLIRAAVRPVGFALMMVEELERDHTPFSFLADFFIIKKHRRQGIGQAAAFRLFDLFPGLWMVSELTHNVAAQVFWRTVIGRYSGGNYREEPLEDGSGVIQHFYSPGRR